MRRFLICVCTLFSTFAFSQIPTGEWRLHIPNISSIDVVSDNKTVYAVFEYGVLEYNIVDGEKSLYDKVNSLSDINITSAVYHAQSDAFYFAYENGNLDKLQDRNTLNIPAIKLSQIQGSKKINKLVANGSFVYCTTDFGIVVINTQKNEVKDTYYPKFNSVFLDVLFVGDSIYALTENEVLKANKNNPALADPSQWTTDNRFVPAAGTSLKEILHNGNNFYLLQLAPTYGNDTIFEINNALKRRITSSNFSHEINSINLIENRICENADGAAIVYNINDTTYHFVLNQYSDGSFVNSNKMIVGDGKYFVADDQKGLMKHFGGGSENISFEGPPRNEFFRLSEREGKIVVSGGRYSGSNMTFNSAGTYVFNDEKWSLFNQSITPAWQGKQIWDYIAASVSPTNEDVIAVGTYSNVPLTVMNTADQTYTNYTSANSILEETSLGNNSVAISDVEYDDEGNLWVLNGLSNSPLKVLSKDGVLYNTNMPASVKSKMTDRLVIDYNGNKWFMVNGIGIVGYNDNATFSNTADDKFVLINNGDNTGALPSNAVTAIACDFDNEIWIGTESGFAILYNSNSALDAVPGNYNTQRIKLEFEGNVEFLLGNSQITDIEIDGGNRKWIGTFGSGIFLLSADGQEILMELNSDNSPLLSNNIIDMQMNNKTGELFIATDLGLISYRSDATYEDPDYTDVQVFPNPVRPGFNGLITIQGIKFNSDVKVTDASGNLVYKTTSNGGTATWDCNKLTGERVATGVYYLWTVPNEGKGKKIGKVVVVN